MLQKPPFRRDHLQLLQHHMCCQDFVRKEIQNIRQVGNFSRPTLGHWKQWQILLIVLSTTTSLEDCDPNATDGTA